MNIKKQIILDDKDYERLVHDANLSKDVKYYSKSIKSDVDSYFEDIQSKVENLRDWGEQWKALAKDLFNELLEIDSDNTIDSYLSYEALEKIKEHLKNQ